MYYYYLQLRTVDGSLVCSFPVLLTPQEELTQWQAQQAAEPAAAGKKAVKKAPAGKGGRADANTANQRNAWYPEVPWLHLSHQFQRLETTCSMPYTAMCLCLTFTTCALART